MSKITRYYFLGIGGIGMSAIARYFYVQGFQVAGYDLTETALTADLQSEGITVVYDASIQSIPTLFLDPEKTLVVLTPAIPADNPQLVFFQGRGFQVMKRAEVLGRITANSKGICVAGTHGKTTTSTIAAHLLYQSNVDCSAFLGGISNNYKTNLLVSKESNLVVIEADEYDRSFHHLQPYMAVITSADPDHLDIYGTQNAFKESFEYFASLVKPGGALIIKKGIDIHPKLQKGVKIFTYSMNQGGDFHALNIRRIRGELLFNFVTPTETIADMRLSVPVLINVENSVAALALAWLNGVSSDELRTGLASFSGIYRRFNLVYQTPDVVFIDDYAHHPQELKVSIESIREMYPNQRITAIFQPHLYSRTRDFADDFAEVLSTVDELIITDIYPAREMPLPGVTSQMLLQKVTLAKKSYCAKNSLAEKVSELLDLQVLVTFGAGDIEAIVPLIKKVLKEKKQV